MTEKEYCTKIGRFLSERGRFDDGYKKKKSLLK